MFKPKYTLTPKIVSTLMRIDSLRKDISGLPITADALASLQETARLQSVHYSTQIAGNRLTQQEVIEVIKAHKRGEVDQSADLKKLDARQHMVLSLFNRSELITSKDVEDLFKISARMYCTCIMSPMG